MSGAAPTVSAAHRYGPSLYRAVRMAGVVTKEDADILDIASVAGSPAARRRGSGRREGGIPAPQRAPGRTTAVRLSIGQNVTMRTHVTPQRMPRRTYRTYYMDSTHWQGYQPRDGDIVISTPGKSGTTWMQRIVSVLVLQDTRLPEPLMQVSPWLDCGFFPAGLMLRILANQRHRRFIKTHCPADALPFYSGVSYLVVGRDLRDAAVSLHNQALRESALPPWPHRPVGDDVHVPEPPVVPEDLREHWREYFTRSVFPWESDGWPMGSPTHHLRSWWEHRHEPNVLFLHYQDLLDDLDGQMRRVGAFLGTPVDEAIWPGLVAACTFSRMKGGETPIFPEPIASSRGSSPFFHKGSSGQWRGVVTEEDQELHRAAVAPLPAGLRDWLARGG